LSAQPVTSSSLFDVKTTLHKNRLVGLWRMLKGYRLMYLAAMLCLGVAGISRTTSAYLLRYLIDDVLGKSQFGTPLLLAAAGFIGLAVLEGSFTLMSGRLAAMSSEGITQRLRNYIYDHIQRLTYAYHAQSQTGELIERSTSDVDALRRFFADQAINIGRIILLFIINFIALYNLNQSLTFISIIVVPFIVLVSAFFFKRVSKAYEAYQEQEATLTTTLQENLSGVRVVKAFARQEYEQGKFEKDNMEKYRRGKHLLTMHSLFWPISDTMCGLQVLGGLFAGALLVLNGTITLGTYMAYGGLVWALVYPMRSLGRLVVQMSTGMVSYQRVMEIVKQEREPLTEGDYLPPENIRGEVIFENVSFEYETGSPVLAEVSFTAEAGKVVALLGSTGSGKTTLVNLLPRFYDVTGGMIKLDGVDIRRYPRKFLRKEIGIVEQEPFLFSRSIRENITYGVGHEVPHEEIEAAAKSAAIHDAIMAFPDGYNTLVGEKGVTLSGGQKQRVAIARTLLKNPRILILDDSTSSVDLETEATIRQALEHLMKNRTTFIIAHRIQSIMTADQILVFDKGKIVQCGTHEELVLQEGVYRQIYDIQTRVEVELEKEIANASV
jgi:ATP-binding cassette subfamily B protein